MKSFIETAVAVTEAAGAVVILAGIGIATVRFVLGLSARRDATRMVREYRHGIAHAILLGLELLVAADILNTVAIDLTLSGVAVLAGIVAIRTVLSFTLELELEGRWPWQRRGAQGEVA